MAETRFRLNKLVSSYINNDSLWGRSGFDWMLETLAACRG